MPNYKTFDYDSMWDGAIVCEPEQRETQDMNERFDDECTGTMPQSVEIERLASPLAALLLSDVERLKEGRLRLVTPAISLQSSKDALKMMGEFERRTKLMPHP